MKNIFTLLAIIGMLYPAAGCSVQKEYQFAGRTMGTTYHIKLVAGRFTDIAALQARVDDLLGGINQSMSTYRPDSEISRFNALTDTTTSFTPSHGFLQVLHMAGQIYQLTQGAWDGTVNPLVNLWGFGKAGPLQKLPSPDTIQSLLEHVGFAKIEIAADGGLKKKDPLVTLDLASIAKGYAVDQVAALLEQMAYRNYLVEIGGEVFGAGRRKDGHAWRVGINQPGKGAAFDAVYKVVTLKDQAMATSGDYRNYYEIKGSTYSHIIDPRTGHPVDNGVVSVSVIADNCGLADGLATGLMVMGPQQGMALLDRLTGVEGLIVVRHPDGRLENFWSKGLAHGMNDS